MEFSSTVSLVLAIGGVLIGLAGLGAAWYFWWRNPRQGSLTVISTTFPISVPRSERVEVRCDDSQLSTPYVWSITLRNTGSRTVHYKPSKAQDFRFTVVPETDVLSPTVHLLQAPVDQLQPKSIAPDFYKTLLVPAAARSGDNQTPPKATAPVSLDEFEYLVNGGLSVPVQEMVLRKGDVRQWIILTDGRPQFDVVGAPSDADVAMNPSPSSRSYMLETVSVLVLAALGPLGFILLKDVFGVDNEQWLLVPAGIATLGIVIIAGIAVKRRFDQASYAEQYFGWLSASRLL